MESHKYENRLGVTITMCGQTHACSHRGVTARNSNYNTDIASIVYQYLSHYIVV